LKTAMPKQDDGPYPDVTSVDVQLATAYYPLLVELARQQQCVSYGELVARAKVKYPGSPVVRKAIVVSTGRRLDVVRLFTSARTLPDLTSLVVDRGAGERGAGFAPGLDPEGARGAVFAFDWTAVATEFNGFAKRTEAAAKRRKTVKESVALELMAAHYREHKDSLPPHIRERRDLIIELIMEGFTAEEAFERAVRGNE
jgi:hypothetical protein